jgi:hypothetical protein
MISNSKPKEIDEMINLLIDTVGFLLVACRFVIANMQLTLNPAPVKRTPGPVRRMAAGR